MKLTAGIFPAGSFPWVVLACCIVTQPGLVSCGSSPSGAPSPDDKVDASGDSGTAQGNPPGSPGMDHDGSAPDGTLPGDAGPGGGIVCTPDPGATAAAPSGVVAIGAGGATAPTQTVSVDGSASGRAFDGIGAISGGGGNSRLLFDYPEPYRSQVLDYLFKPGFGASLQILKVEIGGDGNSTDGSEPSHMHTASDLTCNRGWEYWLMKEAKARNPAIKLYGLSWGAPGWITGGTANSPFSSPETITYLTHWLDCAKSSGLTIDYIGGQNERSYDTTWYKNLHAALVAGGYPTRVVAADGGWDIVNDMVDDAALASAIDIVGAHYPCNGGDGSDATTCPSPNAAKTLGKPLWASENGSQDESTGAAAIARAFLRGYIDGRMTAFINWPVVAAIPQGLPWETMGLMTANAPWSGNYHVGKSVWVVSQITQFAQPGWSFIDSASGYIAGDHTQGSYVTLKSNTAQDYTVLIETAAAKAAQTLAFEVKGVSSGVVHVWGTNLSPQDAATNLAPMGDVTPTGGAFWVTLKPGFFYSVSTVSPQGKGTVPPPPAAAAALPYTDTFEGRDDGTPPRYLCDQDGSFEIATCATGHSGHCLRQAAPAVPIEWASNHFGTPSTIVGTNEWRDYTVSSDVLLEEPGSVELIGRFSNRGYYDTGHANAYYLSVTDAGAWSLFRNDANGPSQNKLASGSVAALGTMKWHTIALKLQGSSLSATIDGNVVGTAVDSTYSYGPAGLAVGVVPNRWITAQFDNLSITPLSAVLTPHTSLIVNRATGQALGVAAQSTADGAQADLEAQSDSSSQLWQQVGDGTGTLQIVNVNSGKPLGSTAGADTPSQQSPSAAGDVQWTFEPTGTGYFRIRNQAGYLAAPSAASSVVTAAADCKTDQQWSLVVVPVSGVTYSIVNRATSLILDVAGVSGQAGANVELDAINEQAVVAPTANQQWQLSAVAGNPSKFTLVNRHSGMALDVPGASSAAGAPLDQWQSNGAGNQSWEFHPTGDGYFTIVGSNGLLIDVANAANPAGSNVVQNATSTGSLSQQWALTTF
jgi:O-glycosyl hydrolase